MRLSIIYRIVRSRAFFIGKGFYFYRNRFLGFRVSTGFGKQPRMWWQSLADGTNGLKFTRSMRFTNTITNIKYMNVGLFFLKQLSALRNPLMVYAWANLRFLKIRHWRGLRYRLGLPTTNQRTHSNASTTRRFRSAVTNTLRKYYWARKVWEARKRSQAPLKLRSKQLTKSKGKSTKSKKAPVRSKKQKKDVWR